VDVRTSVSGFSVLELAREFVAFDQSALAAKVALQAERERTEKLAAFWFSELARVYGMLGRRADVDRLVAMCEAALADDMRPCASVAVAFEWLGDKARADEYLARLRAPDRDSALEEVVEISVRGGRFDRAEQLVERPELRATWFRPRLADLRLAIARGYAGTGARAAALRWLDRAAELLAPPQEYQPNVNIAVAAADLGETARALELARAVDRATFDSHEPYASVESLSLARAFAAAGDQKKVDKILNGYVAFFGRNTAFGASTAALACARFGRTRGVTKLLREAEARLADSNTLDASRSELACAYAANGQIVPAIVHVAALTSPDARANTLVGIAKLVRGRRFEVTPELTTAMQTLGATAG
jgi:hypothetical protein